VTNATNFRSDMSVDGFVNRGDALSERSRSPPALLAGCSTAAGMDARPYLLA
jgi:hypothetical protein